LVGSASSGDEARYGLAKCLCVNPQSSRIRALEDHLSQDVSTIRGRLTGQSVSSHTPYESGLVHYEETPMSGSAKYPSFLFYLNVLALVAKTE
jgi:hypothetical protein